MGHGNAEYMGRSDWDSAKLAPLNFS